MHIFSSLSIRRTGFSAVALAGALSALAGCTDLTETPLDALTPANAFKNDAEILAGAASVYAQLRQTQWAYYNLSEITTDEQIVPTRGNDWFDNGRWIEIYKQTWTANSGSALDDMNGLWNNMFAGVAKANLMIDVVDKSSSPTKAANKAELQVLRAWFYYVLMDMFGGVPIVTTTEVKPAAKNTRDEVFKFIETELKAALPNLPERPLSFGRVNKHVANAILANMYLNAPVFQGTVTSAGITRAAARYAEAIQYADAVINSGVYSLASNWQSNFDTDNASSPELIFVINNTSNPPGIGNSFPQRSLHYAQHGVQGGPWNGFATIAETYRKYDPADQRRAVWLAGQQKSFVTGQNVNDRSGNPLVFTETINDITAATEGEGPRINKFPPLVTAPNGDSHPHKFPYFRLTEMYMIKAEALIQQGNVAGGMAIINQLRARVFNPAKPRSTTLSQAAALDVVRDERLFEFAGEAKRRQDLIRLGGYLDARQFKAASAGYRVLMPIPITQIQNNPLLTQNAGY
ncbi:MAG: RagB/SusD family nutrient uptake outer membrane protein [Gemmatimonadaceae bacterium]|nr:RagB/SusD family nutrient uptake outer membrane protein [Gemmatimonadaceae bacterium]